MLRHVRTGCYWLLLGAGLVLCPTRAAAQFGGINAEFAGGGARSLAMGGAFIALADDATATEFNPAGLWQLWRPEVAAQGIYTSLLNKHDRRIHHLNCFSAWHCECCITATGHHQLCFLASE